MNPITPFEFYCQHVIPLVYDDSLSYYEVLCKIRNKLNEIITSQNSLNEQFKNLLQWITERLKEYTKEQLEEWLKDGTLESLINRELLGKICLIYDGIEDVNTFLNNAPNGSTIKFGKGEILFDYILLDNKKDLTIICDKGTIFKTRNMISTLPCIPYYENNDFVFFVLNDCTNISFLNFKMQGLYIDEDSYNTELQKWSHAFILSGNSDRIVFKECEITNIPGEGILGNNNGTLYINKCFINVIRNSGIANNQNCKLYADENILKKVGMFPNVSGVSLNGYCQFTKNEVISVGPGVKLGHFDRQVSGVIANNVFTYQNRLGSIATYENCFSPENMKNIDIIDNIINNYYFGINASIWNTGEGLRMLRNIFNNTVLIAISSFSSKNNVTISDNQINGGTHGIRIVNDNVNIKILNNFINNVKTNAIWFNGTGNQKCLIDENTITNCPYGILIQAKNPLNEIGSRNVFNSVNNPVTVDINNANYLDVGLINNYLYNPIPVLETNGDIDGVTKHSPSMNRGNVYITPLSSMSQNYIIFRLDNGHDGQEVNFLFSDSNTKILVKNVNNNSGNIVTSTGEDLQPTENSIMTLKCFSINDTLIWKVLSIN